MPENVTLEDLNYIMEFGTLHGKVDNFVCQTTHMGTQQIKIVSDDTYKENAVNTALRIRARSIFSFAMSSWNPQTDHDFRDKIRNLYDQTIYLFSVGQVVLKAQYFNIRLSDHYVFKNRTTSAVIFSGYVSPNQSLNFTESAVDQYFIDCYRNDVIFFSIELKTVPAEFDISNYFKELF